MENTAAVESSVSTNQTTESNKPSTGGFSRALCVLGGIVAIFGGINLVGLEAFGANSLLEAIAHGIGWYCIGKGLFMAASPFQFKATMGCIVSKYVLNSTDGSDNPKVTTTPTQTEDQQPLA